MDSPSTSARQPRPGDTGESWGLIPIPQARRQGGRRTLPSTLNIGCSPMLRIRGQSVWMVLQFPYTPHSITVHSYPVMRPRRRRERLSTGRDRVAEAEVVCSGGPSVSRLRPPSISSGSTSQREPTLILAAPASCRQIQALLWPFFRLNLQKAQGQEGAGPRGGTLTCLWI